MGGPEWQDAEEARQRDWDRWLRAQRRWLTAAWAFALALNGIVLVAVVASPDPALIAVAGGLVGNLIVMLSQVWIARRSEAGRGQPRR
jgi:hypothetical protein